MHDPLMTPDEAAAYLAISRSTLITWRSRRPDYGPRAIKIGGLLRYRLSDLNDWLQGFEESGDSETPSASNRANKA
ncbi:helix-turn-helix transcriptional regulator [Nocardioides jejuensis]|uniref:DNA-binding protein n=1 Tax=Nocardioides jejuensis TaxID=2502782 RepID=A0A4R1BWB4_9ACTN|nr:helix-turn-helix domain-containing protein [Nocardioides jejuensis]TCJ21646.1 DNA-binding protein [Nocardioides jejuensis]